MLVTSRWRAAPALGLLLAVAMTACGPRDDRGTTPSQPASRAGESTPPATGSTGSASKSTGSESAPRIVFLGDSLTAGLGLPIDQSYPSIVQRRLRAAGLNYEVVNAGVSGDTSAGGLSRLDWALDGNVRVLVVALGGNDGLRGLPPDALKHNLAEIITRAQARGIAVILAGMEAPPNYGRDYIVSFHKVYPALAKEYHVAFVPFLLQGVAGSNTLNQADGIHPTAAGARIVADNVWAALEPLVAAKSRRTTSGS
jgi:acyl-CoA thioesterase I